MFEISKTQVPIPAARRNSRLLYPFDIMEIGKHFDAPDDMGASAKGTSRRQQSILGATRSKRLAGKKFVTRKEDGGIIRCWRTA